MMDDDGLDIPDFLRIPAERRAELWRINPPRAIAFAAAEPKEESAATRELRAQLAFEKAERARARIDKLKAKQAQPDKLDRMGMEWSTTKCRWVPIWKPSPLEQASPPVVVNGKTVVAPIGKVKPCRTAAKRKRRKQSTTRKPVSRSR